MGVHIGEARLWVLQEVWEGGQCKVEGQVGAEVGVQAWSRPVGIQQGGSKEAEEASHSPLEAEQSLEEEEEGGRACQAFSMTGATVTTQAMNPNHRQPVVVYLVVLASLSSFD